MKTTTTREFTALFPFCGLPLLTLDPRLPPDLADDARRVYRHLGLCCRVEVVGGPDPALNSTCLGYMSAELRRYRVAVNLDPPGGADGLRATLAHELRHVWQVESGRLHQFECPVVGRDDWTWSRWHDSAWYHPRRHPSYYARPWEVDAFRFASEWLRAQGRRDKDTEDALVWVSWGSTFGLPFNPQQ